MLFSGKENVEYNVISKQVDGNKIQYQIDITTKFAQDKPDLKIIEELKNVETEAKALALKPDIVTVNNFAEKIVSLQKLFNNYAEQTPESCEKLMTKFLGEESK